jgi:hypothetical protein
MHSSEVYALIHPLTGGSSSCKITPNAIADRRPLAFWRSAKPHRKVLIRTRSLLEGYLQIAARCGTPLASDGIRLSDGKIFHPDKAVMNAAIEHGLFRLDEIRGIFCATAGGWAQLRTI